MYPILLTSYDAPRSPEPDRFVLAVRGCGVLDFRYRVVQLNRMNWRDFLRQRNPVLTALMAKMNFAPAERPKVLLQILRLFTTMRLAPEKMGLIMNFLERYLALTTKEIVAFEQELDKIQDASERHKIMKLMTPWEHKGRQEGRQEGQLALVQRLLTRRIGRLNPAVVKQIHRLSAERLGDLAEALLDFTGPRDLDRWLANGAGSEEP